MRPKSPVHLGFIGQLFLLCCVTLPIAPTPTDRAIDLIVRTFQKHIGRTDVHRRVSFGTNDWPQGVSKFLKVERKKLPILREPSLTQPQLHILGIAKSGELFQDLGCQEIVTLINPLGGGVDNGGVWCKVRLLEGKEGWLFAKPAAQNTWFVSSIDLSVGTMLSQRAQALLPLFFVVGVIALIVLAARKKTRKHQKAPAVASGDYSGWSSPATTSDLRPAGSSHSTGHYSGSRGSDAGSPASLLGQALCSVGKDHYDKDWNIAGHTSDDGKTLYDKNWNVVGHVSDDGQTVYDRNWNVAGHRSEDGRTSYDRNWNVSGHTSEDRKTSYDKNWNTSGHHTKGGGCFLTTACVRYAGLGDDCHELTVLRRFRERYVRRLPNGARILEEYWQIAPLLLHHIEADPNPYRILEKILAEIREAVALIEDGRNLEAFSRYERMLLDLRRRYIHDQAA